MKGNSSHFSVQNYAGGRAESAIRRGAVVKSVRAGWLAECDELNDVPVGIAIRDASEGEVVECAHMGVIEVLANGYVGSTLKLDENGQPSAAGEGRVIGVVVQINYPKVLVQLSGFGLTIPEAGGGTSPVGVPTTMVSPIVFPWSTPNPQIDDSTILSSTVGGVWDDSYSSIVLSDEVIPDSWIEAYAGSKGVSNHYQCAVDFKPTEDFPSDGTSGVMMVYTNPFDLSDPSFRITGTYDIHIEWQRVHLNGASFGYPADVYLVGLVTFTESPAG